MAKAKSVLNIETGFLEKIKSALRRSVMAFIGHIKGVVLVLYLFLRFFGVLRVVGPPSSFPKSLLTTRLCGENREREVNIRPAN